MHFIYADCICIRIYKKQLMKLTIPGKNIVNGRLRSAQTHLRSCTKNMSHATRRRTANVPVAAPVAAPVIAAASLARPSGRFDALVDMGNPMKGINLFPYLRRRVEGRALGAIGPTVVLELSRTVREAVMPRRWPREVYRGFLFSFACCCCDQGRSF